MGRRPKDPSPGPTERPFVARPDDEAPAKDTASRGAGVLSQRQPAAGRGAAPGDYGAWTTRRTREFWMETWAATRLERPTKAWAAGASGAASTIG